MCIGGERATDHPPPPASHDPAGPGEAFDLFHNGRGWVVRMFEDGDFIQII